MNYGLGLKSFVKKNYIWSLKQSSTLSLFLPPCKSDMISIYWLFSFAYYDENLIEY